VSTNGLFSSVRYFGYEQNCTVLNDPPVSHELNFTPGVDIVISLVPGLDESCCF